MIILYNLDQNGAVNIKYRGIKSLGISVRCRVKIKVEVEVKVKTEKVREEFVKPKQIELLETPTSELT